MIYETSKSCQILALPRIYGEVFGDRASGAYIEVGAFDGVNWSNTYGLARMGWRGLLFEPQTDYYQKCVANYLNYPNVKIENCCIGSYDGNIKLYIGGSLTTTVEEVVDIYNDTDWGKFSGLSKDRFVISNIRKLDTVLPLYNWPHEFELLVVDVEGAEMSVLDGISLDVYSPLMMIVETHEDLADKRLSHKAGSVYDRVKTYGYEKIYHDPINSIYVRR